MRKRILSILLVLCLSFTLAPFSVFAEEPVASGTCGSNLRWAVDNNGVITIDGSGDMKDYLYLPIPPWSSIKGSIRSVVLEEGVEGIGAGAFWGCSNITSVTIPTSVTQIGILSFHNCNNIEDVYYSGTEEQWSKIDIDEIQNQELLNARIHFNSDGVTDSELTVSGEGAAFGHRYVLYDESMKWTEARDYCESQSGHLVTITSQEEQAFIESLVANGAKKQYWIGLETTSGSPLWITGEPFSYANWDKLEPHMHTRSDGQSEYYCHLLNTPNPATPGSRRFAWNDMYNDNTYPGEENNFSLEYVGFICEFDNGTPTEPPSSNIVFSKPSPVSGTFYYYLRTLNKYTGREGKANNKNHYTFDYDDSWFANNSATYQHDLAKMSLRVTMAAMGKQDDGNELNYANIENLMTQLNFDHQEFHYPDPEQNSVGFAIGSKNLQFDTGEKCSLLMVAIRGGGYFDEWGGNVTLGPAGNHNGFQRAANQVLTGIYRYIKTHYDAAEISDNIKIWICGYSRAAATANLTAAELNKQFGKDHVYAYCFECPQGTTDSDAHSSKYDNIFNIVNPIDLVTKVAMSRWNFTWYGKTLFLPSEVTNANYFNLKKGMKQEYGEILLENGDVGSINSHVAELTRETIAQAYVFDDFISSIAGSVIGGREFYAANIEGGFAKAIANAMGGNGIDADNIWSILTLLMDTFPLYSLNPNKDMHIANAALFLAPAHYPELCLSWLDSLNETAIRNTLSGYRVVFVNCPVDVTAANNSGTVVAKIVSDEVAEIDGGIGALIDGNGQKMLIFPMDGEYHINLNATDNGNVTYTVADYDYNTGTYTHLTSYTEIPIQKGDALKGEIPEAAPSGTAVYSLEDNSGKPKVPEINAAGNEVHTWTVSIETEGDGTAIGGGSYLAGEFAKVTAAPDENGKFLGWYIGGKKVSDEAEYRFLVEKDITLTAKFAKNSPTPSNPFNDVVKGQYYYDPVLWAVNHQPQITNGTNATTFSPDATCTRGQVVTFLWRAAGEPKPSSTKNPFTDVKMDAYYYNAVLWAVEKGITNGTSVTTFSPNDPCTRAHVVTFLWRSQGSENAGSANPFTDVPSGQYYTTAVLWAVNHKPQITNGTSATSFSPSAPCTRGQIVTFLYRYMG